MCFKYFRTRIEIIASRFPHVDCLLCCATEFRPIAFVAASPGEEKRENLRIGAFFFFRDSRRFSCFELARGRGRKATPPESRDLSRETVQRCRDWTRPTDPPLTRRTTTRVDSTNAKHIKRIKRIRARESEYKTRSKHCFFIKKKINKQSPIHNRKNFAIILKNLRLKQGETKSHHSQSSSAISGAEIFSACNAINFFEM